MSNLDRFKTDLDKLLALGSRLQFAFLIDNLDQNQWKELKPEQINGAKALKGKFNEDRLPEFTSYYLADSKRKTVDVTNYRIQDWLNGLKASFNQFNREKYFNDAGAIQASIKTQCSASS